MAYLADSLAKITAKSIQALVNSPKCPMELPLGYGRYLGEIEDQELDILAVNNIPIIAIARRSSRVCLGLAEGAIDGGSDHCKFLELSDRCRAHGANLVSRLFLDVENLPNMSEQYYRGWSRRASAFGEIVCLPCVYMPNRNYHKPSWTALELAISGDSPAGCYGSWVALYDQNVDGSAVWREHFWPNRPKASPVVEELAWQHTGEVWDDRIWVDFSMINPDEMTWLTEFAVSP